MYLPAGALVCEKKRCKGAHSDAKVKVSDP